MEHSSAPTVYSRKSNSLMAGLGSCTWIEMHPSWSDARRQHDGSHSAIRWYWAGAGPRRHRRSISCCHTIPGRTSVSGQPTQPSDLRALYCDVGSSSRTLRLTEHLPQDAARVPTVSLGVGPRKAWHCVFFSFALTVLLAIRQVSLLLTPG